MLLSNTAIFEALDDGRLIIEPQPRPRFKTLIEPKSPHDSTAILSLEGKPDASELRSMLNLLQEKLN